MKIGIIGSGGVAQTLGDGFIEHGHQVMLGTRETSKLADWSAKHATAQVGSFADAAKFAELLVLAVKGSAALDALAAAGAENIAGKTVIDACNPIADKPPVNGVLQFFTNANDSLMEHLQRGFPQAKFVKAFSSVGAGLMVNPQFVEGRPSMFICGNDQAAKATVAKILDEFGWESLDMGAVEAARAIEPLCILWCIPGFARNQWRHAFKLLRQGY